MVGGGGFWPSVRIVLAIRHDITLVGARRVYLLQGYTHTYAYARRTHAHAHTNAARTHKGGMKGGI